jgi:hypothetical protein
VDKLKFVCSFLSKADTWNKVRQMGWQCRHAGQGVIR